jgi:hypothetical protein
MRRTNLFYVLILVLPLFSTIHAQPDTLWTKTYGTAGGEILFSIDQTADGGFIMCGDTGWQSGNDDYWLVRTNAQGDTVWTRTYGGPGADQTQSGQLTADGGYIMAGLGEMWLIRTDANGDTVWTLRSGGPGGSESPHVALTNDGNYIITGNFPDEVNNAQVGIVKVDDDGNILWTKTWGDVDDQYGVHVQPTTDNGYVILGQKNIAYPNYEYWLLKTDAAGDTAWTTVIPTVNGELDVVRQASDGGYAIFGLIFGTLDAPDGEAPRDWLLIKTDASGTVQWSETYGSLGDDQSQNMIVTDDGGFLLTGWSYQTDLENIDLWLVQTDTSGVIVWDTFVGGTGLDAGMGLVQIADGEYAVAGATGSWGAGGFDGWLVRLGAPGETVTWDGDTDNNWTTATNWSGDVVPGAGDDVVIDLDGATVTLPNGAAITVASLILGNGTGGTATLWNASQTDNSGGFNLTVTGDVTIHSDGVIHFRGSGSGSNNFGDYLTVTGTLNNAGTIKLERYSVITGNINNTGLLRAAKFDGTINGNVTGTASSSIEIFSGIDYLRAKLTIDGNLTNAGRVVIFSQQWGAQTYTVYADLIVSNGTFTNTGAIVDSSLVFSPMYRTIETDDFDNQGTITSNGYNGFNISGTDASVANSGHIHVQNSIGFYGVSTFNNTGTITIDTSKTLTLYGYDGAGTYTGSGDQFHGNGTLSLSDIALDVTAFPPLDSLNLTLSGNSSLTLADNLIVHRTLTGTGISITADSILNQGTLTLDGNATLTGDVVNNGTLALTGVSVTGTMVNNDSLDVKSGTSLSAGLINNENAKLVVAASSPAGLSLDGDLTNHGLMILKPQVSSSYTLVSSTNGALINTATGTIQGITGITGSSTSYLDVPLVNEGLFDNHFRIVIRDTTFTNSGIIHINQTTAGTWQPHNSTLGFESGATFINTGTVTLDTASYLRISSATYQGEGGVLDGTGTLSLFKGTGHLGQKFVMKEDGTRISSTGSTIYVDSLINQTTWTARGNTVYADSVIINKGKLTLEPYSSNGYYYSAWHGSFINEDTLIVEPFPQYTATHVSANEILGGPVVNDTGAVLLVQSSTRASATLKVDSSLINHGQLTLLNDPEATYDYKANLNVNKGWLTNSPTGVIDGLAYSVVKADLDNQGTFNVSPNISLTLDKNPQIILNSGTIHVTSGDYFKVMYLDSLVISGTGVLMIDQGCTAKFSGPGASGKFPFPDADFIVNGEVSLGGNIEGSNLSIFPGSTLFVGAGQKASFTNSRIVADSLINEGYITMSNTSVLAEVANHDTLIIRAYGAAFDSTLVNEAEAIIQADGSYSSWTELNVDSMFTNHGELVLTTTSTSSKGIQVNVSTGNLVNSTTGSIHAVVGATLLTALEHRLYTDLANEGTLTVDSAAVLAVAGTYFDNESGGVVHGEGTLNVTAVEFTNAGAVNPGGSPGILTFNGDFAQDSTGVINIEIDGDDPGTGYDQLNISGMAALAGSLNVQLAVGHNVIDKIYQVLTFGSIQGGFDAVNGLVTGAGGNFNAHFDDSGVYLVGSLTGGESPPFINTIEDITAPEDTTLAIVLSAFDPDESDVLNFSASSDTSAVQVAIVEDTLNITLELDWYGVANIEVIVADLAGLADTTKFILTIEERPELHVDHEEMIPEVFALHANYPNPFNPSTTIRFDLPEASNIRLVIYDLLGREVVRLVQGYMEAGYQRVVWNGRTVSGREVPTGIYIARMMTPEYTKSMKMVLLK